MINWPNRQVRVDVAGHTQWQSGLQVEQTWSRWLEDNDFWLVISGEGRISLRQGWVNLRPGVALWLRPGWFYDAEQNPDKPIAHCWMHFDLLDADGQIVAPHKLDVPELAVYPDASFTRPIAERVCKIANYTVSRESVPPAAREMANSLLKALLIDFESRATSQPAGPGSGIDRRQREVIYEMAMQMRHRPADFKSVGELAEELGCSKEHFSRQFKRVIGRSPQQLLIESRLEHACRELTGSAKSVGAIAENCGYSDIAFFSKQFKQFIGIGPLAYRRQKAKTPLSPTAKGDDPSHVHDIEIDRPVSDD